ncbi:hypothetical protein KO481_04005 [Nocardia sp. NEAU-G5]|uniref:Uncharacterized protein n=1 Tax=Nocardia albiluteola TaxID=2842303 RepID=A0ABS6AUP9_9NOCA|nr:hypothetical protein [Nocardia albiluteola]MBU3060685.1 hypothetical protein [Nocardia albiluteola]
MVAVNPQVYYDAARNLTNIGHDIDAATTTLVKALADTGSMAGTSAAATTWATSYDTRASSVIDNARGLGQTLPYFASLIALALWPANRCLRLCEAHTTDLTSWRWSTTSWRQARM